MSQLRGRAGGERVGRGGLGTSAMPRVPSWPCSPCSDHQVSSASACLDSGVGARSAHQAVSACTQTVLSPCALFAPGSTSLVGLRTDGWPAPRGNSNGDPSTICTYDTGQIRSRYGINYSISVGDCPGLGGASTYQIPIACRVRGSSTRSVWV